jgi:hypothetical protein
VSTSPEERSYDDAVEIDDGLLVGSHPEPHDPFELGADVVVTLTAEPSAPSAPPGKLLIHWPIRDGPVPRPGVLRGVVRLSPTASTTGAPCSSTVAPVRTGRAWSPRAR